MFIGIKDSFGTKIREGDIIAFPEFESMRIDSKILYHRVVYNSELCCFCFGPIPIIDYLKHSNTQGKIICVIKNRRHKKRIKLKMTGGRSE